MKVVGGGKSGLEKYHGAKQRDHTDKKKKIKIVPKKGGIKMNRVQKKQSKRKGKREARGKRPGKEHHHSAVQRCSVLPKGEKGLHF